LIAQLADFCKAQHSFKFLAEKEAAMVAVFFGKQSWCYPFPTKDLPAVEIKYLFAILHLCTIVDMSNFLSYLLIVIRVVVTEDDNFRPVELSPLLNEIFK
jgi:hypothetical protein